MAATSTDSQGTADIAVEVAEMTPELAEFARNGHNMTNGRRRLDTGNKM